MRVFATLASAESVVSCVTNILSHRRPSKSDELASAPCVPVRPPFAKQNALALALFPFVCANCMFRPRRLARLDQRATCTSAGNYISENTHTHTRQHHRHQWHGAHTLCQTECVRVFNITPKCDMTNAPVSHRGWRREGEKGMGGGGCLFAGVLNEF